MWTKPFMNPFYLHDLQRTRATQIIPCTVSQLMSASQADESFKVGDVEVAQVSLSKGERQHGGRKCK